MLDLNLSWVRQSRMVKFASTVTTIEEGMAVVRGLEGGTEVCQPSTGATGEYFLGFALNNRKTPTSLTAYEEVLVPAQAPYTVQLMRAPSGQVGIRTLVAPPNATTPGVSDTPETVDTTGTPGANQYDINGRTLTFPAGAAGQAFRVSYVYSPTVMEVQAAFGQTDIGEDVSGVVKATGVIFEADTLFISFFDPTSDWWGNVSAPIYLRAGGYISLDPTAGSKLPDGCYVTSAPSQVSPLLGIRVKA